MDGSWSPLDDGLCRLVLPRPRGKRPATPVVKEEVVAARAAAAARCLVNPSANSIDRISGACVDAFAFRQTGIRRHYRRSWPAVRRVALLWCACEKIAVVNVVSRPFPAQRGF